MTAVDTARAPGLLVQEIENLVATALAQLGVEDDQWAALTTEVHQSDQCHLRGLRGLGEPRKEPLQRLQAGVRRALCRRLGIRRLGFHRN